MFFATRWKCCLCFVLFHVLGFFFSVVLPHKSLLSLVMLLLLSFFMLFETLLPLTILSLLFFFAAVAAAVFVFFIEASQPVARLHQHCNVRVCLLLFLPDPQFFSFLSSLLLFSRLMHAWKSPSTCLSFCLPPPSLVHLSLPWYPCVVVYNWLFVVFTSSPRLCPRLSTAHSRCDEFFWLPFLHLIFDPRFNVLVLDILERSTLICFYHDPAFDWNAFWGPVREDRIERNVMSHVNAAFDMSHSFLVKSFFCVHWSSHLYLPSSQISSQHVRWPDVFVPLVINLKADESMCNWLCKAFNPYVFNRHSCLCHRFLQKLFDLWFRCFTVESC